MYGKIIYWKMGNGHEHSFYTEQEDWVDETNVPDTGFDGTALKTQGDYCDFVMDSENTSVEDEQSFPWNDAGIRNAIEYGAIAIDDDVDEVIDLVHYTANEGVYFI